MKMCASGILLKGNKILLGKRSSDRDFYPNVWDTIGGHSEGNETLEQTLTRELHEEIGIIPNKFVHIAMLEDPDPDIHGDYEYHIYLVTEWTGLPSNLSLKEHSELHWFDIAEALKLKLAHPKYPSLFESINTMQKTYPG